jgi:hypothetical protein
MPRRSSKNIEALGACLSPRSTSGSVAAPRRPSGSPPLPDAADLDARPVGVDVRLIHVLRDPYAVARSLIARNSMFDLPASRFAKGQLTMAGALSLWAEYNRRACVHAETYRLSRLVLWYDHVLDTPCREVARLAEFLGRGDERVAAAVACVIPELRHHRHA